MKNVPHRRLAASDSYIVRLYDKSEGWGHVWFKGTWDECLAYWAKKTKDGEMYSTYSHGDYWSIFPAKTTMLFSSFE